MRKLLGLALIASLLFNVFFLLQRRREPAPPPPPVVRTQVVEKVVEREAEPRVESPPRSLPTPVPSAPIPEPRREVVAPPTVALLTTGYVEPGRDLSVTCTVHSGSPSARHWIGLYPLQAPVTGYADYRMLTAQGGSLVFKAPKKAGDYEFRYVLEDDRTVIATSNPVRVLGDPPAPPRVEMQTAATVVRAGGEIQAGWSLYGGKRSPHDWVGLYPVGAKDSDYVSWKYVTDADRGFVLLKAPEQAGTYEIRYLLDNGYECAATSIRIQVVP